MEQEVLTYLIQIVLGVLIIAGQYKIYEKAGEAGWKAIVPIYNSYILVKILGYNPWLFLLGLIPVVNVIFSIVLSYKLATAFDKGILCTLGLIFVPVIMYPYLGFSDLQFSLKN